MPLNLKLFKKKGFTLKDATVKSQDARRNIASVIRVELFAQISACVMAAKIVMGLKNLLKNSLQ
jgi:hypothetical protein